MRKIPIILFLCVSLSSHAQYRQLRFKKLAIEDGMPENRANCHLEDSYGYHWFGTQDRLVRYDGYQVKAYPIKTANGNSPWNQNIRSIVEDKDRNIWISSFDECIFKFERSTEKFVNYRRETESANYGTRTRLKIDREGKIWNSFSLYNANKWQAERLDPATGQFTVYDSSGIGGKLLPSGLITGIMLAVDSSVWISGNHGLHQFDYATASFKTLLTANIHSIYQIPSEPGVIWMILSEGQARVLAKYDIKNKNTEIFRPDSKTTNITGCDKINYVYESTAKDLWVSTKKGIALFDRVHKTFKPYIPENAFPEDTLASTCIQIWEAKHGELWIRTATKGLLYLSSPQSDLKRFTVDIMYNPDGLPTNFISSTSFVDRDTVLWLVTAFDGIRKLDEKASQFEIVRENKIRADYTITDMHAMVNVDQENALLLGNGIVKYNKKQNRYVPVDIPFVKEKKISPNNIIKDHSGILWIAGTGGLLSYDPVSNNAKLYQNNPSDSNSLSNNNVRCVYEDTKGNLWIGTYGSGLNTLNRTTGKFTRYPYSNDSKADLASGVLDDDQVMTILEDKKGRIWIGTNNGAINLFDPVKRKFQSYYKPTQPLVCVVSMLEDSKGRFWVGTYLTGLFLFDRESGQIIRRFTEKDGLLFNGVSGIKEDKKGRIWVASNRGFTILDGNDFSLSYLNSSNGLPDNSVTSYGIFDFLGDWAIGCNGGFIRFNPDELITDLKPPKLLIESVTFSRDKMDSTIVAAKKSKLIFHYNENRLQFQFVGLNYTNPALIRYEYKLEGYDKEWIKAGTQRSAVYTNLSRGSYHFQVRAANSDGVWSAPVSIDIDILPPWWKAWWAYSLYVLLFGFTVWSYINYRSKKLKRENKLLEEKVQDRTAQLQDTIHTLKTTQSQLIQSEKMASLGELTAGIAHEIQNPLNFVNNFSEVNTELIDELQEELKAGNAEDAIAISNDIKENEQKINHHGKRADAIVKGMLQHSRSSNGVKEPTDINALADEYLRLAYHGLRAKDKSFNATMITDYDDSVGMINVIPQDIGRVILNLITNAFYVVDEKKKQISGDYEPTVTVSTHLGSSNNPSIRQSANSIIISVKDNGNGIPQKVLDKIFQPFFTTKPTGQGTGLGLSLSYDIVKAHGGNLEVETKEGEGSVFIISIPV
ncbi:MAG: two-component regulator propeller domain-containing protein [Bacteroidota bacterium]